MPNYLLKLPALFLLDKSDEMVTTKNEILKINPNFESTFIFFNDERLRKLQIDAYIKVGLWTENED